MYDPVTRASDARTWAAVTGDAPRRLRSAADHVQKSGLVGGTLRKRPAGTWAEKISSSGVLGKFPEHGDGLGDQLGIQLLGQVQSSCEIPAMHDQVAHSQCRHAPPGDEPDRVLMQALQHAGPAEGRQLFTRAVVERPERVVAEVAMHRPIHCCRRREAVQDHDGETVTAQDVIGHIANAPLIARRRGRPLLGRVHRAEAGAVVLGGSLQCIDDIHVPHCIGTDSKC
jgi:hypothetical protein